MLPRVLLVDPDECIVDAFAKFLESRGFDVLKATNERDCVRTLCESAPDVVVLEPDAHGSWGRKLLEERDDNSVPLVVVSRFSPNGASRNQGIPWMTKPISTAMLVDAVSRVTIVR